MREQAPDPLLTRAATAGVTGGGVSSVLVPRLERAKWVLNLYESAGEAGGGFVPTRRAGGVGVKGAAADPDRARAEAARRARTRIRRYCCANGLSRLGTLTYGPPRCTDPAQLRADLGDFFRSLRSALGDRPLPYLWVPELHKDDVHFHVHFAVGRYIPRRVIERAWGRGFVHIKLLSDLPVGSTSWHEARLAARYVSEYVSKTYATDGFGRHRYDVAQGFQPKATRLEGRSAKDVLSKACTVMGREPEVRWSSAEKEGWQGPPALWFAWGR